MPSLTFCWVVVAVEEITCGAGLVKQMGCDREKWRQAEEAAGEARLNVRRHVEDPEGTGNCDYVLWVQGLGARERVTKS